jgi:hypothetical protein
MLAMVTTATASIPNQNYNKIMIVKKLRSKLNEMNAYCHIAHKLFSPSAL